MSETVPQARPINNTLMLADSPAPDEQVFDFKPVVLHRMRRDLMELSERFGIPIKALCGFEFVVQARKGGAGNTTNNLEMICPACDTLFGHMRG
jgi:hypothetical protein